MNKLKLLILLFASVIFIQGCKKDTVTASVFTHAPFYANINGSAWVPTADSIKADITYTAATQNKTLTFTGTHNQKRITIAITISAATNTNDFPLLTYNINATSVNAQYYTQQLQAGQYVFLPRGTADIGSGQVIITAIDPVKKQITGIFNFYSRSTTTDGAGNVTVTVDNIFGGNLNSMPYTFTSN